MFPCKLLTAGGDVPQSGNALYGTQADAVSEVGKVAATASITGTVDVYIVRFQSNLDKVLKQGIAKSLEKQTARFEQELKKCGPGQGQGADGRGGWKLC